MVRLPAVLLAELGEEENAPAGMGLGGSPPPATFDGTSAFDGPGDGYGMFGTSDARFTPRGTTGSASFAAFGASTSALTSALRSELAFSKRCAGSRDIARSTARESAAGTSPRTFSTGGASPRRIAARIASSLSARYGSRPTRAS